MENTRTFETETCSRCSGTGKHSWCAMYRDICFKCRGSGKTYTKRGQIAVNYLRASQQILATDIKPGDQIFDHRGYRTVVSVTPSDSYSIQKDGTKIRYLSINLEKGSCGVFPNSTLRVKGSNYAELVTKALDYQDSLTKAGTPRKSKKTA